PIAFRSSASSRAVPANSSPRASAGLSSSPAMTAHQAREISPPRPPLVRMTRPPRLAIPGRRRSVPDQVLFLPAPRPRLGHGEEDRGGTHRRWPYEPDLLLIGPDRLLAVVFGEVGGRSK